VPRATPDAWANTLLQRLGVHPSPGATRALIGWAKAEGGHWNNSASFNPLNTTLGLPGARPINGVGVKAYRSWRQGLRATVRTLEMPAYRGIVAGLRAGNPRAVADAISRSPWGTNSALIHAAIGAASPGGSQTLNVGGGGNGRAGGALGSVTIPGASATGSVPQGSEGALALVRALAAQQKPQVQSMGLAAPAFSAAPPLPQGYRAPQSGGVAQAPVDTGALLSAIRTAGGDVPGGAGSPDVTVGGLGSSATPGVSGKGGRVKVSAGADRAGVRTQRPVLQFAKQVSAIYGHPLTIGTGTNHSRMTVNGNVSDHYSGNAVDIPASGGQLLRLGRAALVAAGMPAKQARKAKGGLYNVGGHQVIFLTNEGGNHFNHLHISAK
jgi:hypothetical protein